jgi:hypothetical protein
MQMKESAMFNSIANTSFGDADELHCEAYNAAFHELGLNWYWDAITYRSLSPDPAGEKGRLRAYLETRHPHMLKVYDTDFLIDAIQEAKARCDQRMSAGGTTLAPRIDWAEIQRAQVGI